MNLNELRVKFEPLFETLFSSVFIEIAIILIVIILVVINIQRFRKYRIKVSLIDLLYIAGVNLMVRRTRTLVTIIGMSIGIASIVFLVSIGYGMQDLVISEATRLEELKQVQVSTQAGSKLRLNDTVLADLKKIPNVQKTLPVVAIVGDMSYKQSNAAIPVYGVTTDYLKESAIQPVYGKLFESNETYYEVKQAENLTEENETKNTESANLLENPVEVSEGEEFIELDTENTDGEKIDVDEINLPNTALKEIVMNRSAIEIIGLPFDDAVGENVSLAFTVTSQHLNREGIKVVSLPENFTIVGVLSDNSEPAIYTPFFNLRTLGVVNFTEVRIITDDQNNVQRIREQVEVQGYLTTSVQDTVAEIEQLFSSVRIGLGLIGAFGLAIASLGMFNTLTVSLLERTKEIGLMKTIGMKSAEVRLLFLIESLLMGFLGGVSGLLLGYLGGKLISLILTSYSISKGGNAISVSSIPFTFVFLVIALSIMVGYLTGLFPARRATKISALNALRYE